MNGHTMRKITPAASAVMPMTRNHVRRYRDAASLSPPVAMSPQRNVISSMNATEPTRTRI